MCFTSFIFIGGRWNLTIIKPGSHYYDNLTLRKTINNTFAIWFTKFHGTGRIYMFTQILNISCITLQYCDVWKVLPMVTVSSLPSTMMMSLAVLQKLVQQTALIRNCRIHHSRKGLVWSVSRTLARWNDWKHDSFC